ncbi:hypothetical protein SH611_07190 [Geminicoccaceae bacterium 1502E]|nr:hypothetical protein [Geminicoccaceae bacterium 1502E]
MGWYQLDALVHLVASLLVTGYTLFWAIMALALGRTARPVEAARLLGVVRDSRWPHVIVPWSLRLRLPTVGWLLLAATALSGVLAGLLGHSVAVGGMGGAMTPLLALKLVLFVALVAGHALAMRRPQAPLLYTNLLLTVAIVAISANLMR